MCGLFALKARKLLTIQLQDRYIKPKSMYTLVMNHEHIDNP
jgi:ATP-binding cassette subfamily D (ALD) protein 4